MTVQKILLVQDENSPFQTLKSALAKCGFEVTTCTSAFDAIDEMRTVPADLVVANVRLPDLTGFQLSSLFKSDPLIEKIPVAIVGSHDELGDSFWKRASLADLFVNRRDIEFEEEKAIEKLRSLIAALSGAGAPDKQSLIEHCLLPADVNGHNLLHNYAELLSTLLVERSLNHFCRALVSSAGSRIDFMTRYFSYMKRLFSADITGLLVANEHNSWGMYELEAPVAKSAFDKLQTSVNKLLGINAQPQLLINGEVAEKQGATLKTAGTIVVHDTSGKILGIMVLGWFNKQTPDASTRMLLEMLRAEMQPVFQTLHALQEIHSLRKTQSHSSSTDQTTNLYNLEFLIGFLQQQLLFSSRQQLPVGVTLIGVDRLGQINQQFGPQTGDMILSTLARQISAGIRASDLLARYSGDQFAVVLPNTDLQGSQILAEKLRGDIENLNWNQVKAGIAKVTVSVGCAVFNKQDDLNPESILRDAKLALQSAKQSGRNRVAL